MDEDEYVGEESVSKCGNCGNVIVEVRDRTEKHGRAKRWVHLLDVYVRGGLLFNSRVNASENCPVKPSPEAQPLELGGSS